MKKYGWSSLEEQLGLNQHVLVFVHPSFAVPPSVKKQIATLKKKEMAPSI